jgi:hypothetical protein
MNLLNSQGRVFIAEPAMYGDVHEYHGCMRVDSITRQARSVTPHLVNGKPVAQIVTPGGQWTASLTGPIEYGAASVLRRALDSGCILNIQIHYGTTGAPADFSGYEAAFVLENAIVTDYNTSPLTTRQGSETAEIEETVSITFESSKWISPVGIEPRYNSGAGAVVAMAFAPSLACATCLACGRLYLFVVQQVDENIQAFRVMWSDNDGVTFKQAPLTTTVTLSISTLDHLKIACSTKHLFLSIANLVFAVPHNILVDGAPFSPIPIAGINNLFGIFNANSINQLYGDAAGVHVLSNASSVDYVNDALVGENLIMYGTGVAPSPTGRKSFLFHAYFAGYGDTNHIARIYPDQSYHTLSTIVGTTPGTVLVEDTDRRLWFATTDGKLYCGGVNGFDWQVMMDFAPDCVMDIVFESHSVGYLAAGRYVYRTINGGFSWERLPQAAPSDMQMLTLALCSDGALYVGGAGSAGTSCLALETIPETAVPVFARAA